MADTTSKLNVALFIDADNASYGKLESVLAELVSFGAVSIRRAYGNWRKPHLDAWTQGVHEHAIQPVQQFDLIKGKNATDMAMAVDQMRGKPPPSGRGGIARTASRPLGGQCGVRCCSMYWRMTSMGAPPQLPAK